MDESTIKPCFGISLFGIFCGYQIIFLEYFSKNISPMFFIVIKNELKLSFSPGWEMQFYENEKP